METNVKTRQKNPEGFQQKKKVSIKNVILKDIGIVSLTFKKATSLLLSRKLEIQSC